MPPEGEKRSNAQQYPSRGCCCLGVLSPLSLASFSLSLCLAVSLSLSVFGTDDDALDMHDGGGPFQGVRESKTEYLGADSRTPNWAEIGTVRSVGWGERRARSHVPVLTTPPHVPVGTSVPTPTPTHPVSKEKNPLSPPCLQSAGFYWRQLAGFYWPSNVHRSTYSRILHV